MNNHILYNVQCNRVCLYVHNPPPHGLHHNTDQLYEMAEFMNLIKKIPNRIFMRRKFYIQIYALERQLMQK